MAIAVITFVLALALIASEKVQRTKVALIGAAIVVIFVAGFTQEMAIEAIHLDTLGLLAGMMLLVYITQQTGMYDFLAIRAGQLSRGNPFLIVCFMAATVALLSAFLDNLTTILLVVPISFLLADTLDFDPIPLIIIEVMAANIGGTATLIGDPPNIMIASYTGLGFNDFLFNLAPGVLPILALVTVGLYFVFRNQLQVNDENREHVMQLDAAAAIRDHAELKRTLPVLIGTVIAFFVHTPLGIEPPTVALTGAAVALLVTRMRIDEALANIEWNTIFFFVGLFVMVGALEQVGAITEVSDAIKAVTDGNRTAELMGIMWVSSIVGAVVDNIPMTASMIPIVSELQGTDGVGDNAYWWALAFGACFGGNGLIVSAAANVAAAGLTERAGHKIGFFQFMRVGVPVTLISTGLAALYVLTRYAWLA